MIPLGILGASQRRAAPAESAIVGIRRPAIDSAPNAWVCIDGDGDPVTSGWQDTIDSHPTYAGVQTEIIDGQYMVKIPKFWIKTVDLTGTGGVEYYVSDKATPGFVVHPAFYQAGEEIDQFWIGAYHASEVSNVFESQPSVLPRVDLSGETAIERMEARNTGGQSGWGSLTWHQICAVRLLCLIEIGTPDVRTAIGQGWNAATSGAALQPTGTSDANWRGIYDLWGNVQTLCTGLEIRNRRCWLADENGVLVDTGHNLPYSRYIGACAGGDLAWAFLAAAAGPNAANAGYAAYQWTNVSGTRAARHGSSWNTALESTGLFSLSGTYSLVYSHRTYGFRLSKV